MNSTQPIKSATNGYVALSGLIGFLTCLYVLRAYAPFGQNTLLNSVLVIVCPVLLIYSLDLSWQKVHLRKSTELNFSLKNGSVNRTTIKYIGLLGTLAFLALLYWIFPEYHGNFYKPFFSLIMWTLPIWLILAIPYFYLVDQHMERPQDGYWYAGQLCLCQWHKIDWSILSQHILGWLIKGFFLPFMYCYLCLDIEAFMHRDLNQLSTFQAIYEFLYNFLYLIDVAFGTIGYCFAMRLTDTHLRSAESNMSGWVVALICYEPFWLLFRPHFFNYDNDITWGMWLRNEPLMYLIWGCTILFCIFIYVWATIAFGARFSNLTHRGIITNGPYRWTKHPAYIAKNASWWLISVPFMADKPWDVNLRHCLMLLGVNFIYYMRAKTEEWHLSKDPEYVSYTNWIKEHGFFSIKK